MNKGGSFVLIITGILAFLFLGTWVKTRHTGWDNIITTYLWVLFIVTIILIIIGVVYWLFLKRKKNMVAINQNNIYQACLQSKPNTKNQKLAFFGDAKFDLEPRIIGYVLGYCQVKSEPIYRIKKVKNKVEKKLIVPEQYITFIAYRKMKGFIGSVFEKPKIVGLLGELYKDGDKIQDSDYTSLNGEIIYLKGGSFMPTRYELFFLSKHYKKTWLIDDFVKESIFRYLIEEYLIQSQEIVEDGLAIADKYRKERETTELSELKSMGKQTKGDSKE